MLIKAMNRRKWFMLLRAFTVLIVIGIVYVMGRWHYSRELADATESAARYCYRFPCEPDMEGVWLHTSILTILTLLVVLMVVLIVTGIVVFIAGPACEDCKCPNHRRSQANQVAGAATAISLLALGIAIGS